MIKGGFFWDVITPTWVFFHTVLLSFRLEGTKKQSFISLKGASKKTSGTSCKKISTNDFFIENIYDGNYNQVVHNNFIISIIIYPSKNSKR